MAVTIASRCARHGLTIRRTGGSLLIGALLASGSALSADSAADGLADVLPDIRVQAQAGTTVSTSADRDAGSTEDAGQATADEVAGMVRSMAAALRTLDYEGTFVHLTGDSLSSLKIVHAHAADGERERLSALDGEAREVFRDRSLVTCIWPDSRSVVVSASKPRSPLPMIDESLGDTRLYRLSRLADDRVADRATRVIDVAPRDALRYGYRFWIDHENAMLLRSKLFDERGQVVEQMMFTHITFPASIDPERFEIRSAGARASWIDDRLAGVDAVALARSAPGLPDAFEPSERVSFVGLPTGYRARSRDAGEAPAVDAELSHIVLGDGMASVSVYVEHLAPEHQDHSAIGPARMGAMNAFGLSLDNAFVIAVGEVPAQTVRLIAQSVRVSH